MTNEQWREQWREEEWTYVGRRLTGKKELRYVWLTAKGQEAWYSKDPTRSVYPKAKPGARYKVSVTDEMIRTAGEHKPEYVGMINDDDKVLRWQGFSRAAETEARMLKQAKQDMSYDALAELLTPVREWYHTTSGTGRAAILGMVVEAITYGRRTGR